MCSSDLFEEPFFTMMHNADTVRNLPSSMNIKGYIASVQKPSQLKVRGTQEKITIDLFVNGRLREKDILRHIPIVSVVMLATAIGIGVIPLSA